MQYTLDGTTIITAVISALWIVTLGACRVWVSRMQSDAKDDRKAIAQLQKDLADFREAVVKHYASRDEVKDEREETRTLLRRIDERINELQAYLMKANKP